MKRVFTLITISLILAVTSVLFSQVPQGFNYQAIARDGSGNNLNSKPLIVDIGIMSDTVANNYAWRESHSVTTNEFGLFAVTIGKGTKTGGTAPTFDKISWSAAPMFIRTRIQYNSVWREMGAAKLWSVPYAMLADKSLMDISSPVLMNMDTIYFMNNVSIGSPTPGKAKLAVVSQDDASPDPLFEVKRADGQTVFAVYNDGVNIYVPNIPLKGAGSKGGFAIGGFDEAKKGVSQEFFRVTRDSIRMYIDQNPTIAKGAGTKGGFAIGGFDEAKGIVGEYFGIGPLLSSEIINPSQPRVLWYPKKEAFLVGRVLVEHSDSVGLNSFASGYESKAIGVKSQAMGHKAVAKGNFSTAIGNSARASGNDSYAFGSGALAAGQQSFAFGSVGIDSLGNLTGTPTKASGDYSVAIGMGAQTTQRGAMALGIGSVSSGYYSTSLGYYSNSTDYYATAIGFKSSAQARYSGAFGAYARATGISSLSLGYSSDALNSYSVAIGFNSQGSGYASTAIGFNPTASQSYSTAIGYYPTASGSYSTAIGYTALSQGSYSTAIGYNARALGLHAYAFGTNSYASLDNGYAIGNGAQATQANAYAIGKSAQATASNAFSIGVESVASGPTSVSIGYQSTSSGSNSVSLGNGNLANNSNAIAIGNQSTASGNLSSAIGYKSIASGTKSIAIGANYYKSSLIIINPIFPIIPIIPILPKGSELPDQPKDDPVDSGSKGYIILPPSINRDNQASGEYSIAIGNGNLVSNGGMAFGVYNDASDVYATAIGFGNVATGKYSLAAGFANNAEGNYSTAIGAYTTARASNSFVIGQYNLNSTGYDVDSWIETDPLFVIGNGPNSTSTSNALRINKNGYMRIDTRSSFAGIDIYHHSPNDATYSYGLISRMYREGTGNYYSGYFYDVGSGGTYHGLYADQREGGSIDVAEYIYDSDKNIEPAEVVVADPGTKESVMRSTRPYQTAVVGIVSTKPHLTLGMELVIDEKTGESIPGVSAVRLALAGRVPCNVTDENGPIKPGDLLTTSSTPGYAMKWSLLDVTKAKDFDELKKMIAENELRRNAVIGKAVEEHLAGKGKIMVLVSLQ